jgi:hypothetical protein
MNFVFSDAISLWSFFEMARRRSSASKSEKPAISLAMWRLCSWSIEIANVFPVIFLRCGSI